MKIKILTDEFSVMKYAKMPAGLEKPYFTAGTEDENSVLCKTKSRPGGWLECEDGFCGLMIDAELDFSLIGIISRISTILADNDISVFVVSTFNTDYIFVKKEDLALSAQLLSASGYEII